MYVAGFVIPVPEAKLESYRAWAEMSAGILHDHGCLEIVESWEDEVPRGRQTDFHRAVAAEPGERIVFTWQVWPDKATVEAAEAAMRTDPRTEIPEDIPFDPARLIYGGFRPIFVMGRSPETIA